MTRSTSAADAGSGAAAPSLDAAMRPTNRSRAAGEARSHFIAARIIDSQEEVDGDPQVELPSSFGSALDVPDLAA
jgi:hypothetical protein